MEIPVIRYSETSGGISSFLKSLILTYPHLKPLEHLHVVVPKTARSAIEAVKLFSTTTPNVSLFITENEAETELWHPGNDASNIKNVVTATEDMLIEYGIRSPFDSGFTFPTDIEVDIETDLNLNKERLSQLEHKLGSWDFNAHKYDVDELLGIVYLVFKKLLVNKDLPNEYKVSDQRLLWFLCVSRAMYNVHVSYHSYWHSVDVAQSTYTLISMDPPTWSLCPAVQLSIVLAALGHDMKHPGLAAQVIGKVDEKFKSRWKSLESFHLEIFDTVLDQLWPSIKKHWTGIVREAIEATELAKHKNYLSCCPNSGMISYVHALKISDLVSAARCDYELYDHTAFLVFNEFYNQAVICRHLGNRYEFPPQNINLSKPLSESFIAMQRMFLTVIIIPYFEWITKHLPWFNKHLETAKKHFQRFTELNQHDQLMTPEEYLGSSLVDL